MSGTYYDRESETHVDGSPIFQTEFDRDNEQIVADILADAWKCDVRPFGRLSALDWYFTRHGRLIGVGELKSRTHAAGEFPTVFLNVRKWLALQLAEVGLGVPAIFVVQFTDCIQWVPLSEIDGRRNRIAGCRQTVKSGTDIEPVIEFVVNRLRSVE